MPSFRPSRFIILASLALLAGACATGSGGGTPVAKGLSAKGEDRYASKTNFISGYSTRNRNGTINVVVEIPAGTSEKWEVSGSGDAIVRDYTGSSPRMIDYLPYPGNYGIVPRTLLPQALGGDGDPLDVILLGPALDRGAVVRARPIGLLRLVDDGERDDKVLAVQMSGPLSEVTDVPSLDRRYAGAAAIIETWFANYKGPGRIASLGIGGAEEAIAVIREASQHFEHASEPVQ